MNRFKCLYTGNLLYEYKKVSQLLNSYKIVKIQKMNRD